MAVPLQCCICSTAVQCDCATATHYPIVSVSNHACVPCLASFASTGQGPFSFPIHVHGQVCHRRRLPRKSLVLVLRKEPIEASEPSIDVWFRMDNIDKEVLGWTKRVIRVGDLIAVNVSAIPSPIANCRYKMEFHAVQMHLIRRWAAVHGSKKEQCTVYEPQEFEGEDEAEGNEANEIPTTESAGNKEDPSGHQIVCDETADDQSLGLPREGPMCRQWAYYGRCTRASCQAGHPLIPLSDRRRIYQCAVIAQRKEKMLNHPAMNMKTKQYRATSFANWLVATFGIERLSSGSGVLDIAGGGGDVAFFLTSNFNVPAIVLDPRPIPLRPTRLQRKQGLRNDEMVPRIQACLTPKLWATSTTSSDTENATSSSSSMPVENILPPECDSNFGGGPVQHHITEEERQTVLNCSMVVGMHPDQATEPIVDFALAHKKPFAVVPCCVFSQDFPDRRLPGHVWTPSGTYIPGSTEPRAVESYDDFLAYLCLKHPNSMCTELPFLGKNTVVFLQDV